VDPALHDEVLVRRTLERYMRFNDDKDLDRVLTLFAPDAVYRVGGGEFVGHDEIADFLGGVGFRSGRRPWTDDDQLMVMPRTTHVLSNPVVDVEGDRAVAESDFVVYDRDEAGHARVTLIGRYRDHLARRPDGTWVFTERTGVSLARVNDPPGRKEPSPARPR
jgi:3-phenylpropionate/cinnamic acid dioxygenase small subunit